MRQESLSVSVESYFGKDTESSIVAGNSGYAPHRWWQGCRRYDGFRRGDSGESGRDHSRHISAGAAGRGRTIQAWRTNGRYGFEPERRHSGSWIRIGSFQDGNAMPAEW